MYTAHYILSPLCCRTVSSLCTSLCVLCHCCMHTMNRSSLYDNFICSLLRDSQVHVDCSVVAKLCRIAAGQSVWIAATQPLEIIRFHSFV